MLWQTYCHDHPPWTHQTILAPLALQLFLVFRLFLLPRTFQMILAPGLFQMFLAFRRCPPCPAPVNTNLWSLLLAWSMTLA